MEIFSLPFCDNLVVQIVPSIVITFLCRLVLLTYFVVVVMVLAISIVRVVGVAVIVVFRLC